MKRILTAAVLSLGIGAMAHAQTGGGTVGAGPDGPPSPGAPSGPQSEPPGYAVDGGTTSSVGPAVSRKNCAPGQQAEAENETMAGQDVAPGRNEEQLPPGQQEIC